MQSHLLHVVTAVSNPVRWESRIRLARDAIRSWVNAGVPVTLVECAYGDRPHELCDIPGVHHVPVRARTFAWNKESLLNIGIARLPEHAQYIGTFDADIHFRRPEWAAAAVHELQMYPVIQPWSDCYDLGPHGEHMQAHKSFGRQWWHGQPVVKPAHHKKAWWKWGGGPYDYAHCGYAWCWTRKFLSDVGGLFDIGAMGSGDYHMALGVVGEAKHSLPASAVYAAHVLRWQERALAHGAKRLAFTWGTIEHAFHGRKQDRGYETRWQMFVEHDFNPDTDLKRNAYGVLEFAGNKPALERAFHRYLVERAEDVNAL